MAISVHEHDGVVIVDAVLQSGLQTGALVQQRVVKKKKNEKNVKLGSETRTIAGGLISQN